MIIIAGCDNTGKTTLANFLSEQFNVPIAERFHTLPPVGHADEWFQFLKRELNRESEVIYDRFFIDEFIYGPIIRGYYILTTEQMAEITGMLLIKQPMVILTTMQDDYIIRSFKEREQYINEEQVHLIAQGFRDFFKLWPGNQLGNVARFNYMSDPNYTRVRMTVKNYLSGGRIYGKRT